MKPLIASAAVLLIVGCSGAASSTATPAATPTIAPTAAPTATPAASAFATPTRVPDCPGGDAYNRCLGPITAGTYTTQVFTPQLTYTVPDGWANYEDLPGNFLLLAPGATHEGIDPGLSDYIGIYTSIAAPLRDCSSQPDPAVGPGAAGYVAWAQSNPDLIASEPTPVTVGGKSGFSIDLALKADADGLCSDPVQNIPAFAEIAVGKAPSDFSASVISTLSIRIEVFDVNGAVLAVLLSNTLEGGSDYPDFWTSAQPIVASLRFAPAP